MGSEGGTGLKLRMTPKLRNFLRKVSAIGTVSDEHRDAARRCGEEDNSVVPFSLLKEIYNQLGPDERVPLHQVLAGSALCLESPKPRERSEELKARLRKLQEMADQKEYDKLVHDITKHQQEPEYFSSYKDQLGFGLHVAVTMFTGFAFGYTVFRSQFRDTPVLHAAGGALGLIIGMLLETLLFIVRDMQKQDMEESQRREKERNKANLQKQS